MKKVADSPGGNGLSIAANHRPVEYGPAGVIAWSNLFYHIATSCVSVNAGNTLTYRVDFSYSTMIDCGQFSFGKAINADSGLLISSVARGILGAGDNSTVDTNFQIRENNTESGSPSSMGFTAYSDDGNFTNDNFRLTGTGPNINTGGNSCSGLFDLASVSRPRGVAC